MKKLILTILVLAPMLAFSQLSMNANLGLSTATGVTQLASSSVSPLGNLNLTYNLGQHYFLRLGYEYFGQRIDTAQALFSSIPIDLGVRMEAHNVTTLLAVGYAYRFTTKTQNTAENKFYIGSLHGNLEFHLNSGPATYEIIGLDTYLDLHINSHLPNVKSRVINLYLGLGVKLFGHK